MKKIISVLIAAVMLFSTFSVFADAAPQKMYIFVKAGAEGGDGSKDNPLGSLVEARDKIREIKKNGQYPEGGIVVYFREGVYRVNTSTSLNAQDSGTEKGPIVYRAYMDEQVKFVGGTEIPLSKFDKVTDPAALERINKSALSNIKVINLYDEGITDLGENNFYGNQYISFKDLADHGYVYNTTKPPEIFMGDTVGRLARYPNDDYTLTGRIIQQGTETQMWSTTFQTYTTWVKPEDRVYPPEPSIFYVAKDVRERLLNWKNEDDIWVYGFFSENWSDLSLLVREIDYTEGIVTTELPSPKPIKTDRRYYFYNILAELDAPGEYYIDRQTGNLYLYPVEGVENVTFSSMKTQHLVLSNLDNVSFKSLAFEGSLNTGVYGEGLTNVTFEHCIFSKMAQKGITIYNCLNTKIISCHFYLLGAGGVYMGINESESYQKHERATDARENLTPTGNVIENCEFNKFNRIQAAYAPAISLGGAGGHIRHCKFHDGDNYAISPDANDLIIEYNEFYDLLRTADDMGLIYDGFSKSRRGQIIRHNYFHDIQSQSTSGTSISLCYADDTKDDTTFESNLIVDLGGRNMVFYANGGGSHKVRNNIVVNADRFTHFNYHESTLSGKYAVGQYDFLRFLGNPAYNKYEHFQELSENPEDYLPPKYNEVGNNVLVNVAQESSTKKWHETSVVEPSLIFAEGSDPGFVDMENGNYILREDSKIYETFPDFVAPDFKKMGMYTSPLKILMGEETKAFYAGSPKVYVGFTPGAINSRHDAYPEIKDGVAYLPVRYIAESIGAVVEYNDATAEITVGVGNTPVVIKPGEYYTVNGNALVPQDKIAEIFSTDIKVFDNGVILMGNDIRIGDDFPELTQELARRLDNE